MSKNCFPTSIYFPKQMKAKMLEKATQNHFGNLSAYVKTLVENDLSKTAA